MKSAETTHIHTPTVDNEEHDVSTRRTELEPARRVARVLLGSTLVFAGTSHLTFARKPFHAQVPPWFPADPDTVVLASGVMEIALGATVAVAPERHRQLIGDAAAAFFTAIFPGNIAQYRQQRDAFGLDTDRKRALRLLGQPLLVAWALWSSRTPVSHRSWN